MTRKYIIITIVAVIGAVVLLFLPERSNQNEIKPEVLFKEINNPSRYLSVDLVAQRIIELDPSILLIDVRSEDQYNEFSLSGSVNVPLDSVLSTDKQDYLNRDDLDVVLYSNDDLYADQAWILCMRLGYKNLYVMKGGLNVWYANILNPIEPSQTAPNEDFDLYTFRLAAKQYFLGGSSIEIDSGSQKENIIVKRRTKKAVTAGGC